MEWRPSIVSRMSPHRDRWSEFLTPSHSCRRGMVNRDAPLVAQCGRSKFGQASEGRAPVSSGLRSPTGYISFGLYRPIASRVFVLHASPTKSTSGIATSKADIALITQRLKPAVRRTGRPSSLLAAGSEQSQSPTSTAIRVEYCQGAIRRGGPQSAGYAGLDGPAQSWRTIRRWS